MLVASRHFLKAKEAWQDLGRRLAARSIPSRTARCGRRGRRAATDADAATGADGQRPTETTPAGPDVHPVTTWPCKCTLPAGAGPYRCSPPTHALSPTTSVGPKNDATEHPRASRNVEATYGDPRSLNASRINDLVDGQSQALDHSTPPGGAPAPLPVLLPPIKPSRGSPQTRTRLRHLPPARCPTRRTVTSTRAVHRSLAHWCCPKAAVAPSNRSALFARQPP